MRRRIQGAVLLSAILCSCSTHQPPNQTLAGDGCTIAADTVRQIVATSSGPTASDSIAPGELAGTIVDAETGKALAMAQVVFPSGAHAALSDSVGHFRVALPRGTTTLLVARMGYHRESLTVPKRPNSGLVAVVALRRAPVVTCPARVTDNGR